MPEIFVFGSNLKGIHKKGAALHALNTHGAILGQGIGRQGTSYAIPTKDTPYITLALIQINRYVSEFIIYAVQNPELTFTVTPIGCGLAGYCFNDIAPMFYYAQKYSNIILPSGFHEVLRQFNPI